MRMSELSRESGVSVPTIKFYLREGLLPAGNATAKNQADYCDKHLVRLRMIRALSTVGRLDLASIGRLLATAEDWGTSLPDLHRAVNEALQSHPDGRPMNDGAGDVDFVQRLLTDVGWDIAADSPSRRMLGHVVTMMRQMGCPADVEFFRPYAVEAARSARTEAALTPPVGAISERMAVMARSILMEAAVLALRRMAQEGTIAA